MKAYLINLDRSEERLIVMTRQLNRLGVKFERVQGIDGSALDAHHRFEWSRLRQRDGRHEWLTGQIGCFMSHIAVWERVKLQEQEFALIVEDDVHLADDFATLCSNLEWIPKSADIVRLETTFQGMRLGIPVPVSSTLRCIQEVKGNAWSTGAYILRRDVAAWLLSAPKRYHYPADFFLFDAKNSPMARALKVFQLNPAVAIQDKFLPVNSHDRHGFSSTIETDMKVHKSSRSFLIAKAVFRRAIGSEVVKFDL